MHGKSYIPTREADFVDWSGNLLAVARAHQQEWGLNGTHLTELEGLQAEVKALHETCRTSMYTKLDMQAKNEKKALLKKRLEVYVRNNLQNNDVMTDNGREALRIPIHDRNPTPRPAPDTAPETETETPLPRTLRIKFRGVAAPRWGKPEGVHGLECRWVVSDAPPESMAGLVNSDFATRSPLTLTFDEGARGRRLYFAVRWEGTSVQKGPWSEIFSTIIP
ncbi:MAG: hypothetical protein LBG84_07855 [Treponema sp.]|jgi:hypothetical protein|nr:hypothetical protein [Treponema sp.]